jgi:ABC-type nickel/cobalt efflux system permease component RcnA
MGARPGAGRAARAGILVLGLLASGVPASHANPFVAGSAASAPAVAPPQVFGGAALAWLSGVQRDMNARIASLVRQAKGEPTAAPVLLAFLTAFVFGLVHAAGPGHGKTFTLSYFLAENPRIGRGLVFGSLISILDSVSSLAIVAAAYLVFRVALPVQATDSASGWLQRVSYALITGIGVWHLVAHLGHGHRHADRGHRGHVHAGHPGHVSGPADPAGAPAARERRLMPLALSIGLVPCPIEIVILVFGLSVGAFGFGIILTLFVSLGQAVALALVALAAMALRSSVLAVAGAASRARVTRILDLGGSLLIVVFGVVLLVSVI